MPGEPRLRCCCLRHLLLRRDERRVCGKKERSEREMSVSLGAWVGVVEGSVLR